MSIKKIFRQAALLLFGVMLLTGMAVTGHCAGNEKADSMLERTRRERAAYEDIIKYEVIFANNISGLLQEKPLAKRAEITGIITKAIANDYSYAIKPSFVTPEGMLYCGKEKADVSGQQIFREAKKGNYAMSVPFDSALKDEGKAKAELINNFYQPVKTKAGKIDGFVSLAYDIGEIVYDVVRNNSGILTTYVIDNTGTVVSCTDKNAYVPNLVKLMNDSAEGSGDAMLGQLAVATDGYFRSTYLEESMIFYSKINTKVNQNHYWVKIVPMMVLENY